MDLAALIEKATLDQRQDTARALQKPRSLTRVLNMTLGAFERTEQAISEAAKIVPPPRPIACGPGCPYCCHIRVTASAPEILAVLAHIFETWDEVALQTLTRKVKNIDGVTRGLNDEARAQLRLPCPLLKDGSCAVHSVRPLSCRALASVNLAACKASYAAHMAGGVPQYDPQYQVANAVGYGLYAGLVDQGYGVENIELTAALALGLQTPDLSPRDLSTRDLGLRWLRGEDPFAAL